MSQFVVVFIGEKPLGKGRVTITAESVDGAIKFARECITLVEITSVNKEWQKEDRS